MNDDLITTREAAAILGIPAPSIDAKMRRGDLTPHYVPCKQTWTGQKRYFSRTQVEGVRDNWRPLPPKSYDKSPSPTECAYLAGFVDGEGTIIIARKPQHGKMANDQYHLQFHIVNTEPAIIQWIKDTFDGRAYCVRRQRTDRKALYGWQYTGIMACHVIQCIRPYLIIKKRQADLAIEFQEHILAYDASRFRPITEEEQQWRIRCKQAMSELNRLVPDFGLPASATTSPSLICLGESDPFRAA